MRANTLNGTLKTLGLVTACLAFTVTAAHATIIDLTTEGSSGTATGAIGGSFTVEQIDPQSTGTGFIQSFVRIQSNTNEEGYNTSLGTPLDDLGGNFTHAIQLSAIPVVTIGGVEYRQFVLDTNESSGGNNELILLNQIQIFQAASDMLHTSLTAATSTSAPLIGFSGATEVFRMNNAGVAPTTQILNDYSLNAGSGSGDMFLYIRNDAFAQDPNSFIILYSYFGLPPGATGVSNQADTSDGFEEWSVLTPTPPTGTGGGVPEPATLALLGLGLMAGATRLRKR